MDRAETVSPFPEDISKSGQTRPCLILIHGIRTDGAWMKDTEEILSPFFRVVSIYYRHYRHFGALKLAIEPWAFLGVLALLTAAYIIIRVPVGWAAPSLAFAFIPALASGIGFRRYRLHRAKENFLREFSAVDLHAGRPPSIIAHSLGTYLTGAALLDHPDVSFTRIVLSGCVLPADFPWRGYFRYVRGVHVGRVEHVRNEIGLRDWVPRVAGRLSRFSPDFGSAGFVGFSGVDGMVHTYMNGDIPCPRCQAGENPFVHNVKVPFDHSSGFVGGLHCRKQWLPFLLGYDPGEHREVLRMCEAAAEEEQRGGTRGNTYEQALAIQRWRWAGRSLRSRVVQRIRARRPDLRGDNAQIHQIAGIAIYVFRMRIVECVKAWESGEISRPEIASRLRDLNLALALERSIEAALNV